MVLSQGLSFFFWVKEKVLLVVPSGFEAHPRSVGYAEESGLKIRTELLVKSGRVFLTYFHFFVFFYVFFSPLILSLNGKRI